MVKRQIMLRSGKSSRRSAVIADNYPSQAEVESYWHEALLEVPKDLEPMEKIERVAKPNEAYDYHVGLGTWLKFKGIDGQPFWCLWQECPISGIHRALVHVPGYGTETSSHPGLVHAGYHVLHINPRGYNGPDGPGNSGWREQDGTPKVAYINLDKPKEYGYRFWFQDAIMAFRWLQRQQRVCGKFGFYGSSQGGGASLILGSILSDENVVGAVAADVPFLTDFRMSYSKANRGAYDIFFSHLPKDKKPLQKCFYTIGFVDTVLHAACMQYPVLLTAGKLDDVCPTDTIRSLFERLPNTRAIVELHGQGHAYTPNFLQLAQTWFNMYL
jgi:cephalosporin-C deacetylase-like acetyl esterase